MAGPTCSVFSPTPFSADEIIQELVRLECLTRHPEPRESPLRSELLSVTNTHAIGGKYKGDGRPIIWSHPPMEAEYLAMIAEFLGVVPKGQIVLSAMCNRDFDHRVLGEMALWIADKTCGFVDLDGRLDIGPGPWAGEGSRLGLPERLTRIPYKTLSGGESEYMFMDRAAFRYWLNCRSFHMVK